jgi:HlyD family secretion protein
MAAASVFSRAFWRRRKLLALAVLAVPLLGLAAAFYPRGPKVQYVTMPVARGDLTITVSATGTLQPGNSVDVGTEVSGRVDQVLADDNDHVKAGQLLAVINTDTTKAQLAQYQATLAQARATLATNQATVTQTEAKRDRYRNLRADGAISLQDMQTADADYARAIASVAQARGQIQSAEAQIANSQTTINKAQVRSPIDGVVLSRKVSTGQTVAASFSTPTLFTLASDLSVMQLQVGIDEADIGVVHEGQKATFMVDAFPNRRFNATLVTLYNSPKTDNGVVTYPGSLVVDNRAGLLRPGLTATAEILVGSVRKALLVPNAALRFTPSSAVVPKPPPLPTAPNGKQGGRVWVQGKTGIEARDLVIGPTDGRQSQVISGRLAPGETVITDIQSRRPAAAAAQ